MDSMTNVCRNYLHGFQDLFGSASNAEQRALGAVKVVTYLATLFLAPLIAVAILGGAVLAERIKPVAPENSAKIDDVVSPIIKKKSEDNRENRETPVGGQGPQISLGNYMSRSASAVSVADRTPVNREGGVHTRNIGAGYPLLNINEHRGISPNKRYVFQMAQEQFKQFGLQSNFTIEQYQSPEAFHLYQNHTPGYFQDKISIFNSDVTSTKEYYDYRVNDPAKEEIWVDFANRYLGGGALGHGFVQEEIMVAETPELAGVVADTDPKTNDQYLTRKGPNMNISDEVLKGSPQPLLIKGIHRVLGVNSKTLYGNKIDQVTLDQVKRDVTLLEKPVKYNLLAIAAPRLLSKSTRDQFGANTIKDLFNTVYSGFALAKNSAQKNGKECFIHSGLLGCGVFNNNPLAAIPVQMFAAHLLGATLKLYGVSDAEMSAAQAIFDKAFKNRDLKGLSIEKGLEILIQAMPK